MRYVLIFFLVLCLLFAAAVPASAVVDPITVSILSSIALSLGLQVSFDGLSNLSTIISNSLSGYSVSELDALQAQLLSDAESELDRYDVNISSDVQRVLSNLRSSSVSSIGSISNSFSQGFSIVGGDFSFDDSRIYFHSDGSDDPAVLLLNIPDPSVSLDISFISSGRQVLFGTSAVAAFTFVRPDGSFSFTHYSDLTQDYWSDLSGTPYRAAILFYGSGYFSHFIRRKFIVERCQREFIAIFHFSEHD